MDNQTAIEMLRGMLPEKISEAELYGANSCYGSGSYVYTDPEPYAIEKAIQALEKQALFENEVSNIRDWFVDNKDCLLDDAMNVARKKFKEIIIENNGNEFTRIDLDFIVEDIVDAIQEGILNVLSTYMGEYKEELNEI